MSRGLGDVYKRQISQEYNRAAQLEYPGGVNTWSFEGADQFWMGLRASFPNAIFKVRHAIGCLLYTSDAADD